MLAARNPLPSEHPLGPHPLLELLGRDVAQRERRLLEGGSFLVRLLRDLRGLVVADVRVERGDEHEGILQELGDALAPRRDARGAMIAEAPGPGRARPPAL